METSNKRKEPPAPDQYYWTQEDNWTAFIRILCGDYNLVDPHSMPDRLAKHFTFTNKNLLALRKRSLLETLVSQVFAATMIHSFCLMRGEAKVGNFVFVANGADGPYLLRPTGIGYTLSGSFQKVTQASIKLVMQSCITVFQPVSYNLQSRKSQS